MLNDYFINKCLKVCCIISDEQKNQHRIILENIYHVIKWYRDSTPKDNIPFEFKDKVDLLYYLVQLRMKFYNHTIDDIIERLSSGKYASYTDLLKEMSTDITPIEYEMIFTTILEYRKLSDMFRNKDEIRKVLDNIETGNFEDISGVIKDWDSHIQKAHKNITEINKIENIKSVSSLDIVRDDLSPVMDKLRESVDETEVVKIGYPRLEKMLATKGLEPNRFYLIAGSSGVGKSIMLLNFIRNACLGRTKDSDPRTYLYITAENLIYETFQRFYCCMTGTPIEDMNSVIKMIKGDALKLKYEGNIKGYSDMLSDFDNGIANQIKEELVQTNSNIVFKYVKAKRTTVREVEAICENVKEEHPDLKSVYIDYLNLFKSGENLETRHELGFISQEFKNLAVMFGVPIVSATQLNRSGYDINSSESLTQTGESMQMIDNADSVIFIRNDKVQLVQDQDENVYKRIRIAIMKNRSGGVSELHDGNSLHYYMKLRRGDINKFNFTIEDLYMNPGIELMDYNSDMNLSSKQDISDGFEKLDSKGSNSVYF